MKTPQIVVLISGNGSNLQALIDATISKSLLAEISCVISNRSLAYGLERARRSEIPTKIHLLKAYKEKFGPEQGRAVYDSDLADLIVSICPNLVVCAGWMHVLSATCLSRLACSGIGIINLHPALPGQFEGTRAIERAFEAWQRDEITETGIMVHWVIAEVDRGEPIVVEAIKFIEGDTLVSFEERLHSCEHQVIVRGARIALEKQVV